LKNILNYANHVLFVEAVVSTQYQQMMTIYLHVGTVEDLEEVIVKIAILLEAFALYVMAWEYFASMEIVIKARVMLFGE
jgi:hypothetical protein